MQARWMLSIGMVAVQLACTRASPGPKAAPGPVQPVVASAVAPMTLRYHGEHRGDHPSWIYTAHVSVSTESQSARPAWRRSYRFETISPPPKRPGSSIEGTILLERETLAPLEARSTFGTSRHHAIFGPDRVEITAVADDGKVSRTTVPVQGYLVTDVWAGFDLYVLALPLAAGFQQHIDLLEDDKAPRPFRVSVEAVERVRVPAGDFEAFRIRVDPLDGSDRLRSIYHVRTAAPRVVVRKEYVVNPRTEGPLKQSTGVEELEAIELTTRSAHRPARRSARSPSAPASRSRSDGSARARHAGSPPR